MNGKLTDEEVANAEKVHSPAEYKSPVNEPLNPILIFM